VSKKNSKQEALERAQKYVSGDKLNKSEVKKLEDKGLSQKQIQAVAGSMKTGDKAQTYIDRGSSGGSGGSSKVQVVGGGATVKVNSKGQAVVPGGAPIDRFAYGVPGSNPVVPLSQKQADKINRKVDKAGGSLTPGKGMVVSRFVNFTDPGIYLQGNVKGGGPIRTGGGKYQLPIYTSAARSAGKDGKSKSAGKARPTPGGTGGSTGSTAGSAAATAYQRARDHLSGRTPEGRPPEMFPNGITPGQAVEGVANYAARLGVNNANYSGWMQDRAEADRYQSGTMLQQFASVLPKAPDVLSAKDMIDMANRMNRRIQIS
jgi:hypothetical protein